MSTMNLLQGSYAESCKLIRAPCNDCDHVLESPISTWWARSTFDGDGNHVPSRLSNLTTENLRH